MRYHVTHVREVATVYEILVGITKGKRHFLDAVVYPRMILKYILRKCGECSGLDSIAQGLRPMTGSC